MSQTEEPSSLLPGGVTVYNRFVRTRNVLLSEVDFSPLFETLENHRKQNNISVPSSLDPLFRDLLVGFTLHCASRPRNELMAWTIRYAEPMVNFFFGGDTEIGSVTGRFFDQNVKEAETGEMHQELHRRGKEPHRSMIEFSGSTAGSAINQFYEVSEQRPGKFFHLKNNCYALVTAHPDYDEGWFTNITKEVVEQLDEKETLNLLETRPYYWLCGCSNDKIMDMLAPVMKENPSSIFGDEDTATVNCPRCSANYSFTRTELAKKAATLPNK